MNAEDETQYYNGLDHKSVWLINDLDPLTLLRALSVLLSPIGDDKKSTLLKQAKRYVKSNEES